MNSSLLNRPSMVQSRAWPSRRAPISRSNRSPMLWRQESCCVRGCRRR